MVNEDNERKVDPEAVQAKEDEVRQNVTDRQNLTGSDPLGEREAYADNPRPPRVRRDSPVTFPNVPKEGYKINPTNATQELPPERQAPRPADPKQIGVGALPASAVNPDPQDKR